MSPRSSPPIPLPFTTPSAVPTSSPMPSKPASIEPVPTESTSPTPLEAGNTPRRHSLPNTSPVSSLAPSLHPQPSTSPTLVDGVDTLNFAAMKLSDGEGTAAQDKTGEEGYVRQSQTAAGASFVPFSEYDLQGESYATAYAGYLSPQDNYPGPSGVWPAESIGIHSHLGLEMGGTGSAPELREPVKPTPGQRRRGKCKFFNQQKGFGFVLDEFPEDLSNEEVFVHYTAIEAVQEGPRGFKSLCEGEDVEYTITVGPKGWQAQTVTGPNGAPCVGTPLSSHTNSTYSPTVGTYPSSRGRGGKTRGTRGGKPGGGGTHRDVDQRRPPPVFWPAPVGMVVGMSPNSLPPSSLYSSPLQHTSTLPPAPFYPSNSAFQQLQSPPAQASSYPYPPPSAFLRGAVSPPPSNNNPYRPLVGVPLDGGGQFYPPPGPQLLPTWGAEYYPPNNVPYDPYSAYLNPYAPVPFNGMSGEDGLGQGFGSSSGVSEADSPERRP